MGLSWDEQQLPDGVDWATVLADWRGQIHPVNVFDTLEAAQHTYHRERAKLVPVDVKRGVAESLPVLDVVMWEPHRLRATTWRVVLSGDSPNLPLAPEVQAMLRDWLDAMRTDVDARWALLGASHPDR